MYESMWSIFPQFYECSGEALHRCLLKTSNSNSPKQKWMSSLNSCLNISISVFYPCSDINNFDGHLRHFFYQALPAHSWFTLKYVKVDKLVMHLIMAQSMYAFLIYFLPWTICRLQHLSIDVVFFSRMNNDLLNSVCSAWPVLSNLRTTWE